MDIEKLIERLKNAAGGPEGIKMCMDAATALSTLQAENEKLRSEAEGMRSNWYKSVEKIQKLRAELEQVKRERDAAIADIAAILAEVEEIRRGYGCKNFMWRGMRED